MIFSHGKLLLTSEYVVLDGALALAVPTIWGQEFFFRKQLENLGQLTWEGQHQGITWLKATIDFETWSILETNNLEAATFVLNTLKNCQILGSSKFDLELGWHVTSNLQFPANYGLGSSSTLMSCLANWASVDAFALNELSLGGSGYDIAVAEMGKSILFQIKEQQANYEEVYFNPDFREDLIFVHLNQKQDSREGIQLYRSKTKSDIIIQELSDITRKVLTCSSLSDFSKQMDYHEALLSEFLGKKSVKTELFADCPSFVKSLGAWGGDFVMTSKFNDFEKYFSNKGFDTIISWKDMVYS